MTPPNPLQRAGAAAWALIGILALLWGAWRTLDPILTTLAPVILGATCTVVLLGPTVRRLERLGVGRGVSSLSLSLGVVGLLLLAVVGAAPWAVVQLQQLLQKLPELLQDGQRILDEQLGALPTALPLRVPELPAIDGGAALSLLSTAGSAAVTLGGIVAGVLVGGYLLSDRVSLTELVAGATPAAHRQRTVAAVAAARRAAGGYLRGQLLLATAVAVMTAGAALLIGVPLWLPISLIAGLGNIVPLVGPILGGGIGALVALTVGGGLQDAVLFAGASILIQQIEGLLLGPRILGRELRMRPSSIIITVTVAAAVGGIPAMAVGVPGYVAVREGLRAWRSWKPQRSEQKDETGLDGSEAEADREE